MSRSLILDPISEDAANAPLEIHTEPARGPGAYVTAHSYPDPEQDPQSTAAGREGSRRTGPPALQNRAIPLELYILGRRESYATQRTNLVANPSFETGILLWSFGGTGLYNEGFRINAGAAGAQTRAEASRGEAALRVTTPGGTNLLGANYAPIAVTNGQAYAVSACVRGAAGGEQVQLIVGDGTVGNASSAVVTLEKGVWTKLTAVLTATATANTGLAIRQNQGGAPAISFDVDAVLVENTTELRSYFDGDDPGSSWSAAIGGSTSTQPGDPDDHFERIVHDVEQKLSKIQDRGGTYSRPWRAGRGTFDVEGLAAGDDAAFDGKRWLQRGQRFAFSLEARPFMRGGTISKAVHNQTTDPVSVFTETDIEGSARALGELEITEVGGQNRRGVVAGVELADYDITPASAGVYFQAEALTLLGGAATATVTGAAGAGANVVRSAPLSVIPTQVLGTKISGGSHLSHVGAFRIYVRARPSTAVGDIQLMLEYGQGDLLERRRLAPQYVGPGPPAGTGGFFLVDLGVVRIQKVKTGAQQWEGRILAKSSSPGDVVDLDDVRIVPVKDAWLEVKRPYAGNTPAAVLARDEFDQAAGALSGKVAPVGGTWTSTGTVTDFSIDTTSKDAIRAAVSDADVLSGRYAVVGSSTFGLIGAQVGIYRTSGITEAGFIRQGLLLRYTDVNNCLFVVFEKKIDGGYYEKLLKVIKRVAGVATTLKSWPSDDLRNDEQWTTIRAVVDTAGVVAAWQAEGDAASAFSVDPQIVVQDAALATGGALAVGKPGIYDSKTAAGARTRSFDNFQAFTPNVDAAIFASRRLRWRHDGVIREDAGGTGLWTPVGYEGDPLLVPQTTKEKRSLRVIAFPTRGNLATAPDEGNSDDFNVQLSAIPRFRRVRARV